MPHIWTEMHIYLFQWLHHFWNCTAALNQCFHALLRIPACLTNRKAHHLLHLQHSDIGRTEQICEGHVPILTFICIRWLVLANAINLVEEMKGYRRERERERDGEDINMKEEQGNRGQNINNTKVQKKQTPDCTDL